MKCLQKPLVALGFCAVSVAAALTPLAVHAQDSVDIKMFAPENGARVGIGGFGWFVDLQLEFDTPLANTGFTGFQLTGPGAHNNVPPMPGAFSPGKDDRLPGLIVLLSTTVTNANFAGSCQNVANLFNLTGVTNRKVESSELWSTWIVGAPMFGVNTESKIYVAMAADKNNDGIFNDAPNVVLDADGNGICDEKDLKTFGVASSIRRANFFINP